MVFRFSPPMALSDACRAARALTSCAAAVPMDSPRIATNTESLRTTPPFRTGRVSGDADRAAQARSFLQRPRAVLRRTTTAVAQESAMDSPLFKMEYPLQPQVAGATISLRVSVVGDRADEGPRDDR